MLIDVHIVRLIRASRQINDQPEKFLFGNMELIRSEFYFPYSNFFFHTRIFLILWVFALAVHMSIQTNGVPSLKRLVLNASYFSISLFSSKSRRLPYCTVSLNFQVLEQNNGSYREIFAKSLEQVKI